MQPWKTNYIQAPSQFPLHIHKKMNSQMINEINNHGSGGLTYSQLLQAPSMDDISDYLRDLSNETGIVKNDVNNEEIHSMLRLPPITIVCSFFIHLMNC